MNKTNNWTAPGRSGSRTSLASTKTWCGSTMTSSRIHKRPLKGSHGESRTRFSRRRGRTRRIIIRISVDGKLCIKPWLSHCGVSEQQRVCAGVRDHGSVIDPPSVTLLRCRRVTCTVHGAHAHRYRPETSGARRRSPCFTQKYGSVGETGAEDGGSRNDCRRQRIMGLVVPQV